MCERMKIDCPRPIKPLKTKLSQLELFTPADPTAFDLQSIIPPTQQTSIETWVLGSSGRSQNRSNTCLVFGNPKERRDQHCRSDSLVSSRKNWETPVRMSHQPPNAPLTTLSPTISTTLQKDRAKSPSYRRDILEPHSVYIDPYGRHVPEQVTNLAHTVLQKPRDSPPLNDPSNE
jgi:hypothetical protein